MARNRGTLRFQRNRTIRKKLHLLRRLGGGESVYAWTGGQPGRLSKGKIHCSCCMCSIKSKSQATHRDSKYHVSAIQQMLELV